MRTKVALLAGALVLALTNLALAQEAAAVGPTGLKFFITTVFVAGFGIAIAAFGGSLGQGWGLKSAVEGIARNPEASGKITVTLLIGLAMIESLVIYTLVVELILLYAYPMAKPLAKFVGLEVG
ncbi:MAG: ATP synthase F0 subunit C [Candidatus Desulfofervidus auxilii]|nr:ATP synthase F0 subunit C [Candidatus Desulfofervidus auxilii]